MRFCTHLKPLHLDAWSGVEVEEEGDIDCHSDHNSQLHANGQTSNQSEEPGNQIPLWDRIAIATGLAALPTELSQHCFMEDFSVV
jgi:hypothetical protein